MAFLSKNDNNRRASGNFYFAHPVLRAQVMNNNPQRLRVLQEIQTAQEPIRTRDVNIMQQLLRLIPQSFIKVNLSLFRCVSNSKV